jgi:hypothetical protein
MKIQGDEIYFLRIERENVSGRNGGKWLLKNYRRDAEIKCLDGDFRKLA